MRLRFSKKNNITDLEQYLPVEFFRLMLFYKNFFKLFKTLTPCFRYTEYSEEQKNNAH